METGSNNILVFYSNTNAHGKHDATGAFIPEAEEFQKVHQIPEKNMFGIRCPRVPKKKRRQQVLDTIESFDEPLDSIAFFGHGWPQGIQFGFNRKNLIELVDVVKNKSYSTLNITLFACLAAEDDVRDRDHKNVGPGTDGGFADVLRDTMVREDILYGHVDAHKTAGHTSWNPYLVRFLCEDVDDPEFGAIGGGWLVEPRSQMWKKWVNALRDKEGGLRYRFPFMTEMEIKQELLAA
jgi:hypothetical protein